jgi:hypothetical protein
MAYSLLTRPITFTPDSSCLGSTNIWEIFPSECPRGGENNCTYFLQGPPITTNIGCLPPNYEPTGLLYLGPCPQGYQTCTNAPSSSLTNAATVSTCCPRFVLFSLVFENSMQYIDDTTSDFQCQTSPEPNVDWQKTLGCFSTFATSTTIYVTTSQADTLVAVTVATTDAVNAYAVVIKIPGSPTVCN